MLEQTDLIDIFSTFHPNAEEYNFFSSAHGTFFKSWVTNQTSVNLRKEIIKMREEINEKEIKETIAKSINLKAVFLKR